MDTQLAKQLMFIIENNLKGIFHLGSIDMLKQAEFYEMLMDAISGNKDILRFKKYDETDKIFYLGLKSMRNDIPDFLQSTNQSVISELI
ncbi:hypothetical protein [Lysinibacillus sp. RC79]|uniref:hypothetical protein n=1 Tax=Lysinibacillus sp. RC79 TaxID=3156296 RepID=UPI003512AAF4